MYSQCMKQVTMYTTPTCVYCKMAKEFFKKNGVEYVEKDVTTNDVDREEMVNKSHQLGVPVIEVGDEIFVGFDQKGLSDALGLEV